MSKQYTPPLEAKITSQISKFFNFKLSFFIFLFSFFIFFASPVFAQIGLYKDQGDRGIIVGNFDKPDETLGLVFKNLIILFFTVGGLGFIIMFIWGAVDWVLSGGDKEKIAGARKRIVTAITGLVLLALTFVITIVIGQILGLCALRTFQFLIPRLIDTTSIPCK